MEAAPLSRVCVAEDMNTTELGSNLSDGHDNPQKRLKPSVDSAGVEHEAESVVAPEAPKFKEFRRIAGCGKTVAAVAFSPNGAMLAAASADKTVRVFDAETGEHLATLTGHALGTSDVYASCPSYLS